MFGNAKKTPRVLSMRYTLIRGGRTHTKNGARLLTIALCVYPSKGERNKILKARRFQGAPRIMVNIHCIPPPGASGLVLAYQTEQPYRRQYTTAIVIRTNRST
jgi:hypothetical protein